MGKNTPSILIVDDEEMVLSSLRGVFTLQTDYDVHEASTPKEALSHVERARVDVVISDFLMPEMNGIELLKEIKQLQPEAIRLLLTGYADKENAIKAINEVGLYHYLEKPWDNEALLNIVRNALSEKGLRQQLTTKVRELDQLLRQHGELEAKHRSIERELEMAARIQRSLLPERFPELSGFRFAKLYEPCEALGGDFFDVIGKDDGAVLLVSDVIGHGVQAALTTMLLKGVFQESAARIDEPTELLAEMNRRLHAVLPTGMYAAAAVFYLSSGSDHIAYANAAFPTLSCSAKRSGSTRSCCQEHRSDYSRPTSRPTSPERSWWSPAMSWSSARTGSVRSSRMTARCSKTKSSERHSKSSRAATERRSSTRP